MRRLSLLLVVVLLVGMMPCFTSPAVAKDKEGKGYIIITKDNGKKKKLKESKKEKIKKNGRYSNLDDNNLLYMDLTKEEAKQLKKDKDILLVEEDFEVQLSFTIPEDDEMEGYDMANEPIDQETAEPLSPAEETPWNITAIGVDPVAEAGRMVAEESKVKVGVMDSGILTTPEIDVMEHHNFIGEDDEIIVTYQDYTGHGTSVAGVISAKLDGEGVVGVNPNAALYSLRVFDDENKAPLSRIIEAVFWAIDNGMDVLNMSFSTSVDSEALHYAIQQAYAAGIVMVAAAGNQGGAVQYPAAYDEVVAVGSVDQQLQRSGFSATDGKLDVVAPGEDILSTSYLWGYMAVDGTSLSTAHVTGLASLILQQNPALTPGQVKEVLRQTAIPLDTDCGCGMINTGNVYTLLASGQPIEPGMEPEVSLGGTVPEYEETDYVVGEWSGTNHESLVNDSGVTPANLDMDFVKHYVQYADKYYQNGTGETIRYERSLHARLNYVANSRFLYTIAYYYYKEANKEAVLNPTTIFSKDYVQNLSAYDPCLKDVVWDLYNNHIKLEDGYEPATNKEMASALMGLAIHVSTDAFAHRTLITSYAKLDDKYFDTTPTTTLCSKTSKANCISPVAKENKQLCKHFDCIKKAIQNKWVDSIDIKFFTITTSASIYEDNTNWYPERYTVASKHATKCLLSYLQADSGWQRKTFTPYYDGITYGYDTENLKPYYINAGLDTSFLTDTVWAKISWDQGNGSRYTVDTRVYNDTTGGVKK